MTIRAGPPAASSAPSAILTSSSGSRRRVAHQRQKAIEPTMVAVLTAASTACSQVTGTSQPNSTKSMCFCAQSGKALVNCWLPTIESISTGIRATSSARRAFSAPLIAGRGPAACFAAAPSAGSGGSQRRPAR